MSSVERCTRARGSPTAISCQLRPGMAVYAASAKVSLPKKNRLAMGSLSGRAKAKGSQTLQRPKVAPALMASAIWLWPIHADMLPNLRPLKLSMELYSPMGAQLKLRGRSEPEVPGVE